jgi:hypothetical protein
MVHDACDELGLVAPVAVEYGGPCMCIHRHFKLRDARGTVVDLGFCHRREYATVVFSRDCFSNDPSLDYPPNSGGDIAIQILVAAHVRGVQRRAYENLHQRNIVESVSASHTTRMRVLPLPFAVDVDDELHKLKKTDELLSLFQNYPERFGLLNFVLCCGDEDLQASDPPISNAQDP